MGYGVQAFGHCVSTFAYQNDRTANFVWTEDLLRQYIKDPKGMMIGTTQVYRGLLNDADIDALIVYLRENGK